MMKRNKHMKIKTNIIYSAFALFAFACFAVSPSALAVTPPPDGGYPANNTTGANNIASGEQTLYNNTTGTGNTAIGDRALGFNTTGIRNTASGIRALYNLSSGDGNLAAGAFAGLALTSG